MGYELKVKELLHNSYWEFKKRVLDQGVKDADFISELNRIVNAHNQNLTPAAAQKLSTTTTEGYEKFGIKIFGVEVIYYVKADDALIVIDFIEP